MSESHAFLARTPFFGGLPEAALEKLVSRLKPRELKKGEAIFRENEQGCAMYVVQAGDLLALQHGESGKQVKLLRFLSGDFFGETTLIEMQPRPFSVVAQADSQLLELSGLDLYALYREDMKSYVIVLQNINRELCRRLRRAGNRITEICDEEADDDITQIRPEGPPRKR